jgi:aspartate-semialdehyde dehydrogenase
MPALWPILIAMFVCYAPAAGVRGLWISPYVAEVHGAALTQIGHMGYRVVVAGATGNVGREMLNILAERQFPVDEIAALASRRSLGTEVSFGDKTLKTKDLDTFDFTGWDIALFAIGSDATKTYAPKAAKAGCVVIDNSSLYRYDPDVPLIVPEVNPTRSTATRRRTSSPTPTARPRRWSWR